MRYIGILSSGNESVTALYLLAGQDKEQLIPGNGSRVAHRQ